MIEFVGFIITLMAIFLMFVRGSRPSRELTANEQKQLKELYNELGWEVEKEPVEHVQSKKPLPVIRKPSMPPRMTLNEYEDTRGVESRHFETKVESQHLDTFERDPFRDDFGAYDQEKKTSRLKKMLPITKKHLIVYQTIIGPPKGCG